MSKVDGGDLVARALRREGIEHIFTLSGDQTQAIFDACIDEAIRLIDTRHEQAAVHMADGWARTTGRPGVAVVTAGPGVVDAVPGMAVAFQSASPVVLIGGRTRLSEFEMGFGQDFDQLPLMRPITKWAATCYETKRIPEYLSMAFRHACSGRPGPVYLDIPNDILETEIDEEEVSFPTGYRTQARAQAEPSLVRQAVGLLMSAKHPLVIAGSGVWWSQAATELKEFIEAAQLPLILRQMARGCVAEDHPLCLGPALAAGRPADVILVVGTRINRWLGYGRPPLFADNARWLQIDIEGSEIGRNRHIEVGMVGDAAVVLRQMTEEVRQRFGTRRESAWAAECRGYTLGRRQRLEPELTSNAVPIHPLRLCQEISDFVDREATLVLDGGDIAVWGAMTLRCYGPGRVMDNGNMGFLGSGIPFGLASKLARPTEQVLVLIGDGSFGLNAMEMDTAIRHKLPITVVIGNDGAWGMIKHRQEAIYGPDRVVGTELGFTHYERMVEGLGGYGEFVERPQDIRPALARALASGRPACINVVTDPTAVSPATRRTASARG